MEEKQFAILEDRGVLSVGGADARRFLQGLVSNDLEKVSPERAVHAALLTAQGRYLHDFFIMEWEGNFLLDCEAARLPDLSRRLGLYRLRAAVSVEEANGRFLVAAAFGAAALAALALDAETGMEGEDGKAGRAKPFGGGLAYVDPRLPALGARLLLPRSSAAEPLRMAGFVAADPGIWDRKRLEQGVPDGSRDLEIDKSHLLEAGFDELNGIDWKKGCYVGQEVTARTKYRGLVKRRLLPIRFTGTPPVCGSRITLAGREAGEIRSGRDGIALAFLRLDTMEEAAASATPFLVGEMRVEPVKPAWARF